jgi:hypothetical protein
MNKGSERPDAGLEQLRELGRAELGESPELFERMFSNVKMRCEQSDHTVAGFLRSRSTTVRRLIVVTVFTALAVMGWYMFPLVDEHGRTTPWIVSLATFAILMVFATYVVTRPVHLPALPRWQMWLLVGTAISATVVAAFWPLPAAQAEAHLHGGGIVAGVCMAVGLLLGIPVYALLRLVDRGNALGSLIAAAAAGLAGNFVLKAHCPVPGTAHELFGHASVAVLFVLGLGLVHRLIPSPKPR